MKKLSLLPLPEENKKRIAGFADVYRRMAHIVIEIVSFADDRLIVRVEQKDMVNNRFLTKKELSQRVRDLFAGEIPDNWRLTVSAVDYDRKDIDSINAEWTKSRMGKLGLKNKHVCTYTGINKSTLSSLLAGSKPFTQWHKVALYYFFKYYEVARF